MELSMENRIINFHNFPKLSKPRANLAQCKLIVSSIFHTFEIALLGVDTAVRLTYPFITDPT